MLRSASIAAMYGNTKVNGRRINMREDIMFLNEDELIMVNAGQSVFTSDQCVTICKFATKAIIALLEALKPSYGYSDVGANFMSLIYEYAEYHFGVNGKSESDLKCQAIIMTLEHNGFSVTQINEILDSVSAKIYC